MDMLITPAVLRGEITPPPSKSFLHRYVICAALAEGRSVIRNAVLSDDVLATLNCVESLGARWELNGDTLTVTGMGGQCTFDGVPVLDCGESGSTLRFLLPVALAVCGGAVFHGHGRVMQRPLKPYFDLFDDLGVFYELRGDTLTVRGALKSGEYRLPGNVSSQFFTGLMLALPLVGESEIVPTGEVESADYIEMTRIARASAGVGDDGRHICRGQYRPFEVTVENDWSQAAFWYEARFLGNEVEIIGLDEGSVQGDKRIAALCGKMKEPGKLTVDASQCPDLVPAVAAMAAYRPGTTEIVRASRLRLKESDRLKAMAEVLASMGAMVFETDDGLYIEGKKALSGGRADCHGDHRIAMAAAIAAAKCTGVTTLCGAECVSKSYPDFWKEYRRLGGRADAVSLG